MKDFLTWLSRQRFPYEPLITVEISRKRLLHNLHAFKAATEKLKPGIMVAPVLKSNAYGHGLFEVAEIIERERGRDAGHGGIPFIAVDSYFEAVALRAHGLRTPILIIGYARPETIATSSLRDTAFTVSSLDTLCQFASAEPPCPEACDDTVHGRYAVSRFHRVRLHLKIDTGMRRQGLLPEEIDAAVKIISANPSLELEGICTHLCDANDPDESFTEGQIRVWNQAVKRLKAAFPHLRYAHGAATDGARFSGDIAGNVVRLGIGLYGLSENPAVEETVELEPALKMRTILSGVKRLKAGETVGYGNTFRAEKDLTIATIPVGYYEGLDRRLSSGPRNEARGFVQVGPKRLPCPVIGRVSMNIAVIDVSTVPGATAGLEAVVMSADGSDPNSIISIARACGTIAYEIAVHIPAHLKRVVID